MDFTLFQYIASQQDINFVMSNTISKREKFPNKYLKYHLGGNDIYEKGHVIGIGVSSRGYIIGITPLRFHHLSRGVIGCY